MSAPSPSLQSQPGGAPSPSPAPLSPKTIFVKSRTFVVTAVAAIAAVAGLIANLGDLIQWLQEPVSGEWMLTETIQQSSDPAYVGMSATFQLSLIDNQGHVTGNGEKIKVNSTSIPYSQHQPVTVRGELSGGQLVLNYTEGPGPDGKARPTSGEVTLQVTRSGLFHRRAIHMQGTFSGTAAATKGTVVAVPGGS